MYNDIVDYKCYITKAFSIVLESSAVQVFLAQHMCCYQLDNCSSWLLYTYLLCDPDTAGPDPMPISDVLHSQSCKKLASTQSCYSIWAGKQARCMHEL